MSAVSNCRHSAASVAIVRAKSRNFVQSLLYFVTTFESFPLSLIPSKFLVLVTCSVALVVVFYSG